MIGNIQNSIRTSLLTNPRTSSYPNSLGNQNSESLINRKGLSSIPLEQLKTLLSLPDDLMIGTTVDDGGCFFDALVQALNSLQYTNCYTEKCLRKACYAFYSANKEEVNEWHTKDYGGVDKGENYAFVQYTTKELDEDFNGRAPIWGRQHIEGRILCRELNISAILIIEVLVDPESNQLILGSNLVTKEGAAPIKENPVHFYGKIPVLVVGQNDLHFVPILPVRENANLFESSLRDNEKRSLLQPTHATGIKFSTKNDKVPSPSATDLENSVLDLTETLARVKIAVPKSITIENFIEKIDNLHSQFKKEISLANPNLALLKKEIDEIHYYFEHPSLISRTSYQGGLHEIKEKYSPVLLKVTLYLQQSRLLAQQEAQKINSAFSLGAQIYKMHTAYSGLAGGKKFEKAGLNSSHNIDQVNPVEARSKQNIQLLIEELKVLPGSNINNYCGLGNDEIELFSLLLNLPYKLQHATNHFYSALNAGSLDSYTELHRNNPDYVSPFSTKGNIDKLGNGGFVFFRLYVDPINNAQTRYGESSLVFDLTLLRRCGWISLHDQLNPFPSKSPNTQHFFTGKRLLRTSEAFPLKGQSKSDKSLWGGLLYNYRSSWISSYTNGKGDTLISFGEKIPTYQRAVNFMAEMFYGEDILLGIALSVIRELRYLGNCGFRAGFLNQLSNVDHPGKVVLLGNLIKNLFRIEGKYPVAIRLQMDVENKTQFFKPIAQSDTLSMSDRTFSVLNPDGDGRYNLDMSINDQAMKQAILKEDLKKAEEKAKMSRQQRGRTKTASQQFQKWDIQAKASENEAQYIKSQLVISQEARQFYIDYFVDAFAGEVQAEEFDKIDTYKLEIIYENYRELLEEDLSYLDTLLTLNTLQLRLLSEEPFGELIEDFSLFEELAQCSPEHLEILREYDIAKPLNENGMKIRELIKLYEIDPMHLVCLTCDDLFDLVLEIAPDVNPIVMEYASEMDIELEDILDQLCESDASLFRLNAGLDEEYESESVD